MVFFCFGFFLFLFVFVLLCFTTLSMIMKKEGKQVRIGGWEVYAIRALLCIENDSWHPYQKGWVHWKLLKSGAWNCLDSFKKACLSSSKCKIGLEDIPRTNFLLSFQVYVPACVKMAWGPALKCQIVLNDIFHFGMLMFSSLTQRFDSAENQKTKNESNGFQTLSPESWERFTTTLFFQRGVLDLVGGNRVLILSWKSQARSFVYPRKSLG